jgi:o-succinylbenzoate---CoA ligase
MLSVDFTSKARQFLYHPRMREVAQKIEKGLPSLPSHICLFSSGTTSSTPKGYALSLSAILFNAEAVNHHLHLSSKDIWGLSLPAYHVGGLSVLARAYLTGSEVVEMGSWAPVSWVNKLKESRVSLTTVVPTQVFDLIENKLTPPPSLKYLIVGGDFLSLELENRALALGWPLLRTFGMTEVCSQLATARAPRAPLEILPLHQCKTGENDFLLVKSSALFTLEFKLAQKLEITWSRDLLDSEGFFTTSDRTQIVGNTLMPLGRSDDRIKIKSRLYSLNELKDKLSSLSYQLGVQGKVELLIIDHEREGKKVLIKILESIYSDPLRDELTLHFYPLEIEFKKVQAFERTELGKMKRSP